MLVGASSMVSPRYGLLVAAAIALLAAGLRRARPPHGPLAVDDVGLLVAEGHGDDPPLAQRLPPLVGPAVRVVLAHVLGDVDVDDEAAWAAQG